MILKVTFLGGMEAVILGHILYVVHQSAVGQKVLVFVDSVHCILESQLSTAVLLILGENCSLKRKKKCTCIRRRSLELSVNKNVQYLNYLLNVTLSYDKSVHLLFVFTTIILLHNWADNQGPNLTYLKPVWEIFVRQVQEFVIKDSKIRIFPSPKLEHFSLGLISWPRFLLPCKSNYIFYVYLVP